MRYFARSAGALAAALSLAATGTAMADGKNNTSAELRAAVTLEGVRSHQAAFQSIADTAGGNRFAGLPGHDLSGKYVISKLEEAGYEPVVQRFTYDAFFERSPSELAQVSPTAATYVNGNDFRIMAYSGFGEPTAPLQKPSGAITGCNASDFAGFTADRIALVRRGACTFRVKTANAAAAGARAILIYNNTAGVLNGTLGAEGLSTIPSLGLTQALGEQLGNQMLAGDVVMRVKTETGAQPLETYNVLAETEGGDPGNVVMAGAHLDSVTAGPGINDNGSGSAAILETAIQMAGAKPRNKMRFAWWSAEESSLVGSNRYVSSLSQEEGDRIALYLNFDMIGSPNFVRFVYDGDNSTGTGTIPGTCLTRCSDGSGVIESVFTGYFSQIAGLASEPTPFNGRSDYGPFIAANIPAGGLFTGAEGIKTATQAITYGGTAGTAYDPCYHAACDTYSNNSDTGLDQMSDAVAHAVITFAQNTELVNGIKGKGSFKSPPQSDGTASGPGGGGGLHDEHDHSEE